MVGGIIISSKENKKKQNQQTKLKNHSIHSIYKCYMKGMKL